MNAALNLPELMLKTDLQDTNEFQYSVKHLNGYIRQYLETDLDAKAMVDEGTQLLQVWLDQEHPTYLDNKAERLDQLKQLDLRELVSSVFVKTAYFRTPELYTSAVAQTAVHCDFDDRARAIRTMGEVMAVLCFSGAFQIFKESEQAPMMLVSNFVLPQPLINAIDRAVYLPPMVCEPEPISNNFESAYRTFNDCVVLGKGNGHTRDLCLDVINTQNKVALKLDLDFLCTVEEEPSTPPETIEQHRNWMDFKRQSYGVYHLIAKQGNQFWLTNKVDKRGRMYAQGYHVTTQGTAFKKAMIELHHEELVEGVPT